MPPPAFEPPAAQPPDPKPPDPKPNAPKPNALKPNALQPPGLQPPGLRTLLKREESYAIHALLYLHEHPGAPAARIAADLKLPAAFTAKVLRRLSEAGYVESRAGRTGGVRLTKALADLTLLDVIEAMSGALVVDTCQTLARCATAERKGYCRLNTAWLALSLQFREALSAVRLDALADEPAADHDHRQHDGA